MQSDRDLTEVFNLFALVCVAAVLCGLIFNDRPTEGFHGDTSAVGGGPVAHRGISAGPHSEEAR